MKNYFFSLLLAALVPACMPNRIDPATDMPASAADMAAAGAEDLPQPDLASPEDLIPPKPDLSDPGDMLVLDMALPAGVFEWNDIVAWWINQKNPVPCAPLGGINAILLRYCIDKGYLKAYPQNKYAACSEDGRTQDWYKHVLCANF